MWAVQRFGSLDTAWGPRPTRQALARSLGHFAPYLPVAVNPAADMLELASDLQAVPIDTWREFLTRVPTGNDPAVLGRPAGRGCGPAAAEGDACCAPGDQFRGGCSRAPFRSVPREDEEEARELATRDLPHVVVDDAATTSLTARWGCRPASAHLRVEVLVDAPRTPVGLLDRYRGLRPVAGNRLDGLRLVECSSVVRQVTAPGGVDPRAEDIAVDGDTVYHLDSLSDEELLERLAEKFEVPLTTMTIDQILRDARTEQVNAMMATCRMERDHADKLLVLRDAAALGRRLPKGLVDSLRRMGQELTDREVARLFLDVHGYDALWELRRELEELGLPVPSQWAGTSPAIKFVSELGFPAEYAGTPGNHLAADLTVAGPPELDPLHWYQESYAGQNSATACRPRPRHAVSADRRRQDPSDGRGPRSRVHAGRLPRTAAVDRPERGAL